MEDMALTCVILLQTCPTPSQCSPTSRRSETSPAETPRLQEHRTWYRGVRRLVRPRPRMPLSFSVLTSTVDPPDIIKTNLCAVLEAWAIPYTMPSYKVLKVIGTNLQHQFEDLNPKISYTPILDPPKEDLKRFCVTLRK